MKTNVTRWFSNSLIIALSGATLSTGLAATDYLADTPDVILESEQGFAIWGNTAGSGLLGTNTVAHRAGEKPAALRLNEKDFAKGLGTHAPGEILVRLNGRYTKFEAVVGVQAKAPGSVVFHVYVDGEKRFDSGLMRSADLAKPVSVSVEGARDMRLIVTDGGDGLAGDLANWAEARLTRAETPKVVESGRKLAVDVAPFARLVTFDPGRMDGARATRVQEFLPEDVRLETEILPSSEGTYLIPRVADGRGCIGLQWIERRRMDSLEIEFADKARVPLPEGVEVQCWEGYTLWQGSWKLLKGVVVREPGKWIFKADRQESREIVAGVSKIRWVIPEFCKPGSVRRLLAFTRSGWSETELVLQMDKRGPGGQGEVEIYNGEIMDADGKASVLRRTWDLGVPLRVKVRYCASVGWKSDRTVLRLKLPKHQFGIAVDDLLASDCIYVKDAGLFAAAEPLKVTLEDYKRKIASQKSMLEEIRNRPDQTFEAAMKHVYNPLQDNGPTMLSLACDNEKFFLRAGLRPHMNFMIPRWDVAAEGEILRPTQPNHAAKAMLYSLPMTFLPFSFLPEFGSGTNVPFKRTLSGGWLPMPTTSIKDGDALYTQRTFVAPYKDGSAEALLARSNQLALCVSEIVVENPGNDPVNVSVKLIFMADAEKKLPAELKQFPDRVAVQSQGQLLAVVDLNGAKGLNVAAIDGHVTLTGRMAAHGRAQCFVYIPGWEMKLDEHNTLKGGESLVKETEAYWQRQMSSAMQVEIPDPLLNNVIRASQVHCLIAAYTDPADGTIEPWIASMLYGPLESEANSIIRGMNKMGYNEFTRKSLEYFIKKYSPEGFLTTGYTLTGTGYHLWTLGEYYELTHNAEWLKKVAPEVVRVCRWVMAQREKTKKLDAHGNKVPEYGLLPPGVLADWNAFAYYYCMNGYFYAGLNKAGRALADINYPGAQEIVQAANDFREDIEHAYNWTQARSPVLPMRDGTWAPAYPSQLYALGPTASYFPGESVGWPYDVELGGHHVVPQGVLDPKDDKVRWMMNHMEEVQFMNGGMCAFDPRTDWFNLGGFSKVQPYYTRNAEIYALSDDVKPFIRSYFNTIPSLLNRENLSFWEHPRASLAWNKTHETGYFLQQTRFMLVMERGEELWLAPFVASNWMQDGMVVNVKNAPTRFGKVSYRITSHVNDGLIDAIIEPPQRKVPSLICLRLRHPEGKQMRSVTVNGLPHTDFDPTKEIVRVRSTTNSFALRAIY